MEYADRTADDRDQLRVEEHPAMRALLRRWRELLVDGPRVDAYGEAHLVR